jgi:radical SAM-linked protein
VPLAFTQGYHAHPRVAFAAALPVGEESIDSYVDLVLDEREALPALRARVEEELPRGFHVLGIVEIDRRTPSLMSQAKGVLYALRLPLDEAEASARIEGLLAAPTLVVQRRNKKGIRDLDVRASIAALSLCHGHTDGAGRPLAALILADPPQGSRIRPAELLAALGVDPLDCSTRRVRTLVAGPCGLEPLGARFQLDLSGVPGEPDSGMAALEKVLAAHAATAVPQD